MRSSESERGLYDYFRNYGCPDLIAAGHNGFESAEECGMWKSEFGVGHHACAHCMTFMLAHEHHSAFLQEMTENKPRQLLRESDRQIASTAWLQIF